MNIKEKAEDYKFLIKFIQKLENQKQNDLKEIYKSINDFVEKENLIKLHPHYIQNHISLNIEHNIYKKSYSNIKFCDNKECSNNDDYDDYDKYDKYDYESILECKECYEKNINKFNIESTLECYECKKKYIYEYKLIDINKEFDILLVKETVNMICKILNLPYTYGEKYKYDSALDNTFTYLNNRILKQKAIEWENRLKNLIW